MFRNVALNENYDMLSGSSCCSVLTVALVAALDRIICMRSMPFPMLLQDLVRMYVRTPWLFLFLFIFVSNMSFFVHTIEIKVVYEKSTQEVRPT